MTMEIPADVARGSVLTVTAAVDVKGEPLDVECVVVQLQCLETVAAFDFDLADGVTPPPDVRTPHSYEVEVAAAQVFPAGSHHEYSATFDLPADVALSDPTHTWITRTAVQMPGNDPDSRWEGIRVTDG